MEKKIIFENNYFKIFLYNNIVSIENLKGGAAILPVTKDKKVILLNIYRRAINQYSLEIPRGFSEDGEEPINNAKREMQEEISCVSENIIPLGYMHVDSGLMNSKVNLFLGLDTIIENSMVQEEEGIKNIVLYDFDIVYKMALEGQINDSFTLAAILRSKRFM
ncbi:NUDIX hydrolase [Clostridium tunisiense]|uniref:NUDIX hydrolase n=1 Tax=Clostridium tunisiense TaxID=219748 RepID=UPI0002F016AC|nr:NUDIX hydrolase [Clostridium tunisiense]